MRVVGVDENGLGPQLGPLVATAVTIELDQYQPGKLRRLGERIGIHDSKQVGGHGQMAWTESLVLALLAELHGVRPRTFDELLALLSLDALVELRAPCPAHSQAQCWSHALQLPAFGGDDEQAPVALRRLRDAGVQVSRARSAIACAGTLNRSFAAGGTRVGMDLALFERLLIDARSASDEDINGLCGMVGGIRDYPAYFRAFDAERVEALKPTKTTRAYRVADLGDVRFVIDADATHLPVGLASMVGKYVRELAMERQNRFYSQHEAALVPGSGYHDPVTTRFVKASEPLRRRLQIVDTCFLR